MRDPSERTPGSWPRDRPVRWRGVVGNLSWFVVATGAAIVQLGLAIPVLIVGSTSAGDGLGGFASVGLALVWGGLTLFAAWSWVLGQWRIVLAPVLTVGAILLTANAG